jgi:NTP pyrophosphatase (non-canonical NTP hydrolase)
MIIDEKLLQACIDKWGVDEQIRMIQEECLELALAIRKFYRNNQTIEYYNKVIDEIADVELMLEQAKFIFDPFAIEKRLEYKVNRLKERLNE